MNSGSRFGRPAPKPIAKKAAPRRQPTYHTFMVGEREFYSGEVLLIQRKVQRSGEEFWEDATEADVSGKKPKFGTYRIVIGGETQEIVTFTIAPDPEPPVPVVVKFDPTQPNGVEDEGEPEDDEEDD